MTVIFQQEFFMARRIQQMREYECTLNWAAPG